jgi:lipopolysaccharide export system permease protein
MFNVISRYVFREVFTAWLAVTLILLFILLTNQFAQVLGDAAANRLPREAVFIVLGLTTLQFLNVLAPIGLFLGILLALARLNRDGEMPALLACGVGPGRLLQPLALLTLPLGALLCWLSLVQGPQAAQQVQDVKRAARAQLQLGILESGRFASPDGGDTVIYAQGVDEAAGTIRDVFIQRREGDRITVILAARGERLRDERRGVETFVLYDGKRYEGIPGQRNFRIVEFAEHGIPINLQTDDDEEAAIESMPTGELLRSSALDRRAEFQWRLASPISVCLLMLLAVPLSRSQPRQGRYARVVVGVLVYLLYSNLLAVARVWMESGAVPSWLGLWWVHGIIGAAAIVLLLRQSGALQRTPRAAPLSEQPA